MKDRRVVSLERVLSRRKTLERKLNDALLVLRGEQQALEGALAQCRQAVDQQRLVLLEQNRKLDEMMDQTFQPDAYLRLREHQVATAQRHSLLENQANEAANQVAGKQQQVAQGRAQIVQNRARIDIYAKRRDKLCREIETAVEDAQDEEASESRRPGPRPF
ncbi:type III secretion system protein [Paraburkholderia sediminicola]|uniref:type III secretion system protein n=1 Tax=Paraburkholderia sediminicola TaxID=458836 RepID=UPI0038BD0923